MGQRAKGVSYIQKLQGEQLAKNLGMQATMFSRLNGPRQRPFPLLVFHQIPAITFTVSTGDEQQTSVGPWKIGRTIHHFWRMVLWSDNNNDNNNDRLMDDGELVTLS